MLLSLSLVFNVVLVVCVVSLFKKWWETDDDLSECETRLEMRKTRYDELYTRHDELYKAYSDACNRYYDLSEEYYDLLEHNSYLVESNIALSEELKEFQDKTVKAFKQLKNELQDREDLIANLFEEMEELEADDEPETIEVDDYEVMPELLFLMAPIISEAERMVADAKIEADKIVAEAKAKADQIIANAEIKIKEMLSKANKYKKPTGKPVKPTINKAV